MSHQAKLAIKSLVLDLRHTLEDDIAVQLKGRLASRGASASPWRGAP